MDPGDFLKEKVQLFAKVSSEQIDKILTESNVVTFEPNEAVIEFGEEGRFFGVLLEGTAEVSYTDNHGVKHPVKVLKPGDIFGEMSLMTGDKTMADIIGLSRCKAVLVPERVFSSSLITNPQAIKYLSKTISARIREAAAEKPEENIAVQALQRSKDPYGLDLRSTQPRSLLVVNCGSSSLKYKLYHTEQPDRECSGSVSGLGTETAELVYDGNGETIHRELSEATHSAALSEMCAVLTQGPASVLTSLEDISAVGHRVVHGGERFSTSVVIDDDVIQGIEAVSELAPLHNPSALEGIRNLKKVLPQATHVAVFDTAFHHTLPSYAYLYGLPYSLYDKNRIRRYGFHGSSHFYAALRAAEFLKKPYNSLEIATCHLGNGASLCAVDHGRSVDTSMGFTPSEGLIMGTRCGDVDPAVILYLMKKEGIRIEEMERLINYESGLKGISGVSQSMKDVLDKAQDGDHRSLLAFKAFCYRVRKYIGSYMAAMGGLDVIVFTGGIGERSPEVRSLACQGLDCMNIHIDQAKNRSVLRPNETFEISSDESGVNVLVVPADEERMIAREMLKVLDRGSASKIIRSRKQLQIPLEVSAHHVHLSAVHVEELFGKGYELTPRVELSQPGQYACEETVRLTGPKGSVERVRILGPARSKTQVEIAMTEQFKLGIQPPIRESGDIEGTPGLTLEGPAGRVNLDKGVICAMRHIHMTPEDALKMGLHDKDIVRVSVKGDRELIYGDVLIRINPDYRLAMHIDTDEANAAHIQPGTMGVVESVQGRN